MSKTQQERIIDYINLNGQITQRDAIWLGCYRLAAQIFELKRKGYRFHTEIKEVVNKDGTKSRIAVYSFAETEEKTMEERQVSAFDLV